MTDHPESLKDGPFDLNTHIEYAVGSVVSKTLLKQTAGNITLFAFDAGQELSEHTAPFDALVYIVDGEAEISLDKNISTVRAGQFIIMPAQVPHALKADRKFKMLLVMIRDQ